MRLRRRSLLAVPFALALAGCGRCGSRRGTWTGSLPTASFAVFAVADDLDPFKQALEGTDLPAGLELAVEAVPVGATEPEPRVYVRIGQGDQPLDAALAPVSSHLAKVRLPPDHRIAWGAEVTLDGDRVRQIRWRSYVLRGGAVVDGSHVDRIEVVEEDFAGPSLLVTLNAGGAQAFESFTRGHVNRRAAIVVRDRVESSPVVREAIAGGKVRITAAMGDAAALLDKIRAPG